MKVAVILTGDVRPCTAKQKLLHELKDADLFIGSYEHHREYLNSLGATRRMFLITKEEIRPPTGLQKQDMLQNMLQWMHLDNVLRAFYNELSTYTHILKLRFDTSIQTNVPYMQVICESCSRCVQGVVYCNSDTTFHATTSTFMQTLTTFYDTEIRKHKRFASEQAFKSHIANKCLEKTRQGFFTKIDRGEYLKEKGDGNRHLYSGDELTGKFC